MELPEGLAALVSELEELGFRVVRKEFHLWPGGGDVELERAGRGVGRVRMLEDRGIWDVEVEIGNAWYEPFDALRALEGLPRQQRALSHEERRTATVGLVQRFTGDPAQAAAITRRPSP